MLPPFASDCLISCPTLLEVGDTRNIRKYSKFWTQMSIGWLEYVGMSQAALWGQFGQHQSKVPLCQTRLRARQPQKSCTCSFGLSWLGGRTRATKHWCSWNVLPSHLLQKHVRYFRMLHGIELFCSIPTFVWIHLDSVGTPIVDASRADKHSTKQSTEQTTNDTRTLEASHPSHCISSGLLSVWKNNEKPGESWTHFTRWYKVWGAD